MISAMIRIFRLILFFVAVVGLGLPFLLASPLPVQSSPMSQSVQLLVNSDFDNDVSAWESAWSGDCGEDPVWLDRSFFPDDNYFGLLVPHENCLSLSNGVSQSFYVSGRVGSTYELIISAYSYCSTTVEVYLDDLVSWPFASHSGSGFHPISISGVISDDSSPWSVSVLWTSGCSYPDETWVDFVRFTSETPTNTPEPTQTSAPTSTATETPTNTPAPTQTSTPTSTPTETPTNTPEPFPTLTPTSTPSPGGGGTPTFFPFLRASYGVGSRDYIHST